MFNESWLAVTIVPVPGVKPVAPYSTTQEVSLPLAVHPNVAL